MCPSKFADFHLSVLFRIFIFTFDFLFVFLCSRMNHYGDVVAVPAILAMQAMLLTLYTVSLIVVTIN